MCKVLKISRSLYYYHINLVEKEPKEEYEKDVISAFKESHNVYGAKKIRNELRKRDIAYLSVEYAESWKRTDLSQLTQ
jgi:hypothetical protein